MSASNNKDVPWPPQTTQDVLNLTPRKNRPTSSAASMNPPLSPSPLRKSTQPMLLDGSADTDEDDEDEDEETLQLKIQQIQAKLKLKRLRKKKAAAAAAVPAPDPSALQKSPAKAALQVPASPSSRASAAQQPASPKSPSRVLLGIDKGLTGRDVSLRRAPQYRNTNANRQESSQLTRQPSPPRPIKTFSQRMQEERAREKSKAERAKAVEASRSRGFGLETADKVAAAQKATHTFTSVLQQFDHQQSAEDPFTFRAAPPPGIVAAASAAGTSFSSATSSSEEREKDKEEAGFDSYSGIHLIKRSTPHVTVTRHLSSKTIFTLPQLLQTVVSPDFDPPDVEGDWVTLGVIAWKSEPRHVGQNTGARNDDGKKYMVMQLTDLKWEIELFLFGQAFKQFYTLPVGAIVALLNPGVMKPRESKLPNTRASHFSLTLTDDHPDAILEIGLARDLTFCKSIKRDGNQCGTWIDKRHTQYCAFHSEVALNRARASRPEVNSMTKLFSPPKKGGVRQPKRWLKNRGRGEERDSGLLRDGPIADLPTRFGGAGGSVFVAPGRPTAALLDDEDYLSNHFHRGTKEERLRKRLLEAKKERELTKRLIQAQGKEGGMGTEYLKKNIGTSEMIREGEGEKREVKSSMLSDVRESLKKTNGEVKLSPIKRKREGTVTGVLKKPGDGRRGGGGEPVAKRTRIVLPGDDSDDGLDIV